LRETPERRGRAEVLAAQDPNALKDSRTNPRVQFLMLPTPAIVKKV
jgi:hypothetical protein